MNYWLLLDEKITHEHLHGLIKRVKLFRMSKHLDVLILHKCFLHMAKRLIEFYKVPSSAPINEWELAREAWKHLYYPKETNALNHFTAIMGRRIQIALGKI